jgi:hypothetical protein
MNNIGLPTSSYANAVSPFNPLGKQAVGQESPDAKNNLLPPVEESAESANTLNENDKQRRQQGKDKPVAERGNGNANTEQERQEIAELAARDREVRTHERAHSSVGGQFAGAPSYTFKRGPDGVNYAVGGEVSISIPAGGGDPEQTLRALEQVRRAALAPADPSGQDRRVAASASAQMVEARAEIREQQQIERQEQLDAQAQRKEQLELQQQQRDSRLEVSERSNALSERLIGANSEQQRIEAGSLFDQRV